MSLTDPHVWSGRASQEVSSIWRLCGLAAMYPASDWSVFVFRHHGYQRACVLITGQASSGAFGSKEFAGAGKTSPPFRFILTSLDAILQMLHSLTVTPQDRSSAARPR